VAQHENILDGMLRRYRVKIIFRRPLLGTVPLNEDAYAYTTKDTEADGIERVAFEAALETLEERLADDDDLGPQATGFLRLPDGKPCISNHMIKGFFKEACWALRREPKTATSKLAAYKKVINGTVFIEPRLLELHLPDGAEIGVLFRSLRGQTARGERVAIARSEMVPEGTWAEFVVVCFGRDVTEKHLREWLSYGYLKGLGQWRSNEYGAFTYELEPMV